MGAKELEEFGHLFGDARFRTIRAQAAEVVGHFKVALHQTRHAQR